MLYLVPENSRRRISLVPPLSLFLFHSLTPLPPSQQNETNSVSRTRKSDTANIKSAQVPTLKDTSVHTVTSCLSELNGPSERRAWVLERWTQLLRIWEVPGSILGPETVCSDSSVHTRRTVWSHLFGTCVALSFRP